MSETFQVRQEQYTFAYAGGTHGALVWLTGTVATAEPEQQVRTFLERVHQAALASGTRSVTVDIRRLEFISSSAIKPLVDWVWRVRKLDQAQRFQLRFLIREELRWQARLLAAMSQFAPELVQVEARSA